MKKKPRFPPGWNEERVRKVIAHYESQTDEEAVAEDEAAFQSCTMMAVPNELVPAVAELLDREAKSTQANHKQGKRRPVKAT